MIFFIPIVANVLWRTSHDFHLVHLLSKETSHIFYMQANAVELNDAVKANDVAAVRRCLDSGADVDLAYVRYQSFLSHPINPCPSNPPVCLSISPLSCSFAFFLVHCL